MVFDEDDVGCERGEIDDGVYLFDELELVCGL